MRQNHKSGFLSIDIAFSLLILSFAFILLLQAQNTITKQLNTHDMQNLYKANETLFYNLKHNICKRYTLKTQNNHTYNACMLTGKANDEITLHYYAIQ